MNRRLVVVPTVMCVVLWIPWGWVVVVGAYSILGGYPPGEENFRLACWLFIFTSGCLGIIRSLEAIRVHFMGAYEGDWLPARPVTPSYTSPPSPAPGSPAWAAAAATGHGRATRAGQCGYGCTLEERVQDLVTGRGRVEPVGVAGGPHGTGAGLGAALG